MENYLLERKLREESKDLHRRAAESVFVLQTMLSKYLTRFPDFTDHSFLHSMNVIDYCNRIIGDEQIKKLCPEECYVLIMSCYLHDIGMGIGNRDFAEFSKELDFGDYFDNHDRENDAETVRAFHNEYSGLFIRKYSKLFDIPSEEMTRAIIQVARGHRKTDLLDSSEFGDIRDGDAIIRTAYSYIYENHLEANYRFDVCEVFVEQDTLKLVSLNYFENAFAVEGDYGYF